MAAPLKQNVFSSATTSSYNGNCIRSKECMYFLVLNCNDTNKAIGNNGRSEMNISDSNTFIEFRSISPLRWRSLRSGILKDFLCKITYCKKTRPKLNLQLCRFIIKHFEVEGQSTTAPKSPYCSLITPRHRPSATFH